MVPLSQNTLGSIFSDKITDLKASIESNNKEGNLDGLFSKFAIGELVRLDSVSIRNISTDLKNETKQGNFLSLSRIGYSLSIGKYKQNEKEKLMELFSNGLKKLKVCNVFTPERISFVFYPREFLGIVLGTQALSVEESENYKDWLSEILDWRLNDNQVNRVHKILYQIIYTLLSSKVLHIETTPFDTLSFYETCVLYWGVKKKYFTVTDLSILHKFQLKVLENFIEESMTKEEWLMPVVYFAVKSCLIESINQAITSKDHVVRLLSNFESAMKRWPNKKDNKWLIKDEKDIQSILWVILRSVFDDVADEDPTYKFGHRFSIVDFRIPSLNLLIEAKFLRKQEDFAKVENEIKIDTNDYLAAKPNDKIIVFIYDNSASVEEHQTTMRALESIKGIHKVIIVSKPARMIQ